MRFGRAPGFASVARAPDDVIATRRLRRRAARRRAAARGGTESCSSRRYGVSRHNSLIGPTRIGPPGPRLHCGPRHWRAPISAPLCAGMPRCAGSRGPGAGAVTGTRAVGRKTSGQKREGISTTQETSQLEEDRNSPSLPELGTVTSSHKLGSGYNIGYCIRVLWASLQFPRCPRTRMSAVRV